MNMDKDKNVLRDGFNAASEDRIARILTRLSTVPEGKAVADFLTANNVEFDLQDDPENWAASTLTITNVKDGVYSYADPVIILKTSLSDDNLLQAIVHESQHLKQHLSGVGNPDRILSQEQYILFYRAAEADAQALCTEICWRLKEAGDEGPWKATANVGYKDVCDAFEKKVTANPDALDSGDAKRAAFDAWFDNPSRLAGYNAATVEGMIPFLEEGREIFKEHAMEEKPLDKSWLKKLDAASPFPYLTYKEDRNILTDGFYIRELDTRPPKRKVSEPKPPKAA